MKSLLFRGVTLERIGFAGIILRHAGVTICVDVVGQEKCSVALYTHNHPRHAPNTLPSVPVFSPFAGTKVRPGDRVTIAGNIEASVVEAYNAEASSAVAHPRGLGVGFLLKFPTGLSVYYAGDTDLVEELYSLQGAADLAVLPVGGGSVMSPEEAAEAVKTLRPAVAVPVHEESIADARKFKRLAQPYTQVVLMRGARG